MTPDTPQDRPRNGHPQDGRPQDNGPQDIGPQDMGALPPPEAPLPPPEDDEALAAEMALGLLEGPEAAAAAERMARDPEFARAVRDWQERLAGLAEALVPVMAPARARQAIRERLGHAQPPLSRDPLARAVGWRRRGAALAGLAAVAASVAFLALPGLRQEAVPPASYRAELVTEGRGMQVMARVEGREFTLHMQTGTPPEDRDLEIWWLASEGSAPVSIGLVPRAGTMRRTLPEGLAPASGVRIALSDEPLGGSLTGTATGPVVAVAPLTSL